MRAVGALAGWGGPSIMAALIGGVAIAVWAGPENHGWLRTLGLAWAVLGLAALVPLALRRNDAVLLGLVLIGSGLGLWRATVVFEAAARPWTDVPGGRVGLVGRVEGAPRPSGAVLLVNARVERIYEPPGLTAPDGAVQLALPVVASIEDGDRLDIVGSVEQVGQTDSWGRHLLSKGIIARAAFPSVQVLQRSETDPFTDGLRGLRAALKSRIDAMLVEPYASLVSGLVLGLRGGMSEEFKAALLASGTTHIVVVSGYNLSLIAAALGALARGRIIRLIVPLIGVVGFTVLTGAAPPTLRAAVMCLAALSVGATGRATDALSALGLAAATLLLVDPLLISDLSFQLSALATLGLITLQPRVAALLRVLPAWVRDPVSGAIGAQLATLPVLAGSFHQVSAVAPISNVLVGPLIPALTIAGGVAAGIAVFLPALSVPFGLILTPPAWCMTAVIELVARVPGALTTVGELPAFLALIYAALLALWAVAPTPEARDLAGRLGGPRAGFAAACSAAVVVGFGGGLLTRTNPPNTVVITVLDVGRGDAVLVRTPSGRTALIDGGPNPSALLDQLGKRLGAADREISLAVLTRAEQSSLAGLVAAAGRYRVRMTVSPPGGSHGSAFAEWRASAPPQGRIEVNEPVRIDLDSGVALEIAPTIPVDPARGRGPPQPSLAVRVVHGDVAVLVAPFLTKDAAELLDRDGWRLSANAMVVPRHGAERSVDGLIEAVGPSLAVISGASGRDGLPHASTIQRLAAIPTFRTDLHGSVRVSTDGHGLSVETERDPAAR